jgi:Prokaryotic homologs of the JAB domain
MFMKWVEIDTSPTFPSAEDFLKMQQTGIEQRMRSALKTESVVMLSDKARKTACDHVSAFREEQGGLLIGDVYQHLADGKKRYVIVVTDAVVGVGGDASAVSISIPADTWIKAAPLLDAGKVAIGWYHSHPNLGAFFSGTDRTTQKNFYSGDHQVGWVIDWIKKDEAWFIGKESRQLDKTTIFTGFNPVEKQTVIALPDRSGSATVAPLEVQEPKPEGLKKNDESPIPMTGTQQNIVKDELKKQDGNWKWPLATILTLIGCTFFLTDAVKHSERALNDEIYFVKD